MCRYVDVDDAGRHNAAAGGERWPALEPMRVDAVDSNIQDVIDGGWERLAVQVGVNGLSSSECCLDLCTAVEEGKRLLRVSINDEYTLPKVSKLFRKSLGGFCLADTTLAAIDRSRTDDGDLGYKRIRAVAAVYFFRKQVFCFEEDE